MNIVILSDRYHPTPVSGAVLMHDLACELADQGHNIHVLTADSNLDSEYSISNESKVNVLRVRTQNQKKLNKPNRLLFELLLQRKIWKVFKKANINIKFDMLIAHSPTIFWSFLLKKLRKEYKSLPTYLILRDIFPKWAVDTGIISRINPIYWFLKWHEENLYKEVDTVGVQSQSNKEHFKTKKNNLKIEVLYNFKKIDSIKPQKSNIRDELNLQNKVIFVFGGNLGFAQDIDNLLRLVNEFKKNESIHFLFIGEGTEYNKIKSWINNKLAKNIHLMPAVSDIEYQSILKECDVGIISLRRSFKTDNFPNKIMNYMEYGLPILASINPGNDLGELIKENNNGLVSDNGNDEEFVSNAKIFLNNYDLRKAMGGNGKQLLQDQFNVKKAVESIIHSAN